MLTRLIYINIGLFVIIGLLFVGFRIFTPATTLADLKGLFYQKVMQYLMLSAEPVETYYPAMDPDHLHVCSSESAAHLV